MDENLPNKIDRLFNDALTNFKSDPADEVWNKIEAGLDRDDKKIGWFFVEWKRYTALAMLLLAGLGVIYTVYFRPDANVNPDSALQEKSLFPSGNSLLKPPPVTGTASNTDAHEGRKNEKRSLWPVPFVENRIKRTAKEIEQTALAESGTQYIDGRVDITHPDADWIQMQKVSVQMPESRLPLLSERQPGMPVNEKDKTLTLIHQRMPLKSRFSVTPYFSQEFAGYSLADNDLPGVSGHEMEERERNVFSASVGFYFNYRISKRWVLQSGISYSWSNSHIDSSTSYAVKDIQGNVLFKLNTISGYGYLHSASAIQPQVGDSVSTAKSFSQLHYLTIPLIVSYRIPWKNFSLLIGAGASFNVLTSAEIETKTYGNGNSEKEYAVNMMGLKKSNFGMILKLDLEYKISSRMGVNIIPSFKNTFSPINPESAVIAYPYNFGIGAGVTYRF